MSELDMMRGAIDEIDNQIVHLFERRMAVTRQVGEYKQKISMPVLDTAREREVLAGKAALVSDPKLKTGVTLLYETIMGISRRQQREIVREGAEDPNFARFQLAYEGRRAPVSSPRVVYQGCPGAYSEQAALNFFGPEIAPIGLRHFEDVFVAIKEGKADYGVVPIENNSTGAIRQIYDLLSQYEFYLVGETTVPVEHCLMAPPGATLDTITHVYSHEQGLFQSEKFLNDHPDWIQTPIPRAAQNMWRNPVTLPRPPFARPGPQTSMGSTFWSPASTTAISTPPALWWSPHIWSCVRARIRSAPSSPPPMSPAVSTKF